jgi:tetratricopeptide (TPR) repeat protein
VSRLGSRGPISAEDDATAPYIYLFVDLRPAAEGASAVERPAKGAAERVIREHHGEPYDTQWGRVAEFRSIEEALAAALAIRRNLSGQLLANVNELAAFGIGMGARGGPEPLTPEPAIKDAVQLARQARPSEILVAGALIPMIKGALGEIAFVPHDPVPVGHRPSAIDVVSLVERQEAPDPLGGALTGGAERHVGQSSDRQSLPLGGFLGALSPTALVGRDWEVSRLVRAVDDVLKGAGRVVMVEGEEGVGKTRLGQELTRLALAQEFLVAAGQCREGIDAPLSVPFHPFIATFSMLQRVPSLNDLFTNQVRKRWLYLSLLLPNRDTSDPPSSSPSELQSRMLWAVSGFVQAVSALRPLLLMIDDLQWADRPTLDLIEHLARQTKGDRVLIFCARRLAESDQNPYLERWARQLSREDLSETLRPQRLSTTEIAQIITHELGTAKVPEKLITLVVERTEGNPSYAQEMVRTLRERGQILRLNGGNWTILEQENITIPPNIGSAVLDRLSRLDSDDQNVLYTASVLGPTFSFFALRHASDAPADEIDRALARAVEARLVQVVDDEYRFDPILHQQVIEEHLKSLRQHRWRELHRAAGEALIRLAEEGQPTPAAEIAQHFIKARCTEEALDYVIRAGDEAEAVFAHEVARDNYQLALDLSRQLTDRRREMRVLEKLAVVLATITEYRLAIDSLEAALRLAESSTDDDTIDRILARIGRIEERRRNPAQIIPRLEARLQVYQPAQPSAGRARLLQALAELYADSNDERALETATQASALARQVGLTDTLVEAETRRGLSLMYLGRWPEAKKVFEDSLALVEELPDQDASANTLREIGFASYAQGDLTMGMRFLRRALDIAARLSDPVSVALLRAHISRAAFFRGDWRAARDYAEQAITIFEQVPKFRSAAFCMVRLGILDLLEGRIDDGISRLERASTVGRELADIPGDELANSFLAEYELTQGQYHTALDRLLPVMQRYAQPDYNSMPLWPFVAWAYLSLGKMEFADDYSRRAYEEGHGRNRVFILLGAGRVRGMVLRAQGKYEEALGLLLECQQCAASLPAPYYRMLLLREIGLVYAAQGNAEGARAALLSARRIGRELGDRLHENWIERDQAELGLGSHSEDPGSPTARGPS